MIFPARIGKWAFFSIITNNNAIKWVAHARNVPFCSSCPFRIRHLQLAEMFFFDGKTLSRWWFQIFFIFTSILGNDQI